MKYLKIYENYFSDRDEIDELYIKKEDDFVQEVLDLIPDICSINGFELKKKFSTKNAVGLNIGFKNRLNQDASILVKDYKDIIISDIHRLDKFLSSDYDISYSVQISIFDKNGTFINHDTYNKIEIDSFKDRIKRISEIKDERLFTFTGILIYINRK